MNVAMKISPPYPANSSGVERVCDAVEFVIMECDTVVHNILSCPLTMGVPDCQRTLSDHHTDPIPHTSFTSMTASTSVHQLVQTFDLRSNMFTNGKQSDW